MKSKIATLVLITLMVMFANLAIPVVVEANLGDRILKVGMQGYDVNQLQRDLNYLGYSAGPADSKFGWQTYTAVSKFQKDNGLAVDGIVGKMTATAIIKKVSQGSANTTTPSRGSFLSSQDINDLVRLVYGEARGEPFEGQVAVAAVALNRVYSKQFANTVKGVVFEAKAFTAVSDGQFYLQPNNVARQAVDAALKGWDPTGGALYYWNPVTATNKWVWSRSIITQIGRHVFAI
ncbi:spore cortex-lytic enzyme, lytic transglycosylase sleb [hydrocarbon metagenome]|uniref:Spore cortex-lytic enzyme n=1 Tax=hydrocarbon metagenome TaxID=938273 RepID=A0A0W8E515_9ZZZZ